MSHHKLANLSKEKLHAFFNRAIELTEKGLVAITKSSTSNLYIVNYTDAQNKIPAADWCEYIINMRGTLLRIENINTDKIKISIVGCVLPKFWSYHNDMQQTRSGRINAMRMKKYDGTLINITYISKIGLITWTRNSFDNQQTKLCKKYLTKECEQMIENNFADWTFSFELVHPDDPKVQFHREFGLFLIWAVKPDGTIIPIEEIENIKNLYNNINIKSVEYTKFTNISISEYDDLMIKHDKPDHLCNVIEGYVWLNVTDNINNKSKNSHYMALGNGVHFNGEYYQLNKPTLKMYREHLKQSINPEFTIASIESDEFKQHLETRFGTNFIKSFYEIWDSYHIEYVRKQESIHLQCVTKYNELINDNTTNPTKEIGVNKKKISKYIFPLLIMIAKENSSNSSFNIDNFTKNDPNFNKQIRLTICKHWESIH